MFVGITFGQVYIPTGVSTQSQILRNVPTSVVRVPANTYITDGNRAYLTAQVTPFQWVNTRVNDDNKNRVSNDYADRFQTKDHEDNIRRLLAADREERLSEFFRFVEQRNNENRRSQSNDRYWSDREEILRDLWRLRDDGNSRQSHELNRNQLNALLNRENTNNHNNEDRNRNDNRNNDRNDHNDRNDDRNTNGNRNERLRDLTDVWSRTSGRN